MWYLFNKRSPAKYKARYIVFAIHWKSRLNPRMHARASVLCFGGWSHAQHLHAISIDSSFAFPFWLAAVSILRLRILLSRRVWRRASQKKSGTTYEFDIGVYARRKITRPMLESGIILGTRDRNFPRTESRHASWRNWIPCEWLTLRKIGVRDTRI